MKRQRRISTVSWHSSEERVWRRTTTIGSLWRSRARTLVSANSTATADTDSNSREEEEEERGREGGRVSGCWSLQWNDRCVPPHPHKRASTLRYPYFRKALAVEFQCDMKRLSLSHTHTHTLSSAKLMCESVLLYPDVLCMLTITAMQRGKVSTCQCNAQLEPCFKLSTPDLVTQHHSINS